MKNTIVRFSGYFEYESTHWHGEFDMCGHGILPDGRYDYGTLRTFKIPVPAFPNYYQWRKAEYERMLCLRAMTLDQLSKGMIDL